MLDLSSLVGFFVLGVIGWAIYQLYIWPYYISPTRKIPGPPSENPFSGTLGVMFSQKEDLQLKWVQKYGKIMKIYEAFNRPAIFLTDTKIIQEITTSRPYDFIKTFNASFLTLIGRGLVYVEGNDHKRQRKMMSPAFTYNSIKEMVPSFTQVAFILKDLIENEMNLGESNINFSPYFSKATLDVIGIVGFNYEFNSLTSSNELAEAYDSLLNNPEPTLSFFIATLSNFIPSIRNVPIDVNKKFKNACAVVNRVSKKLIEEKCNEAEKGELKGKDLLSLLININKTLPIEEKMTNDELQYQIMTFLLAGHETTSALTCWALYLLAQNPHYQDLLRKELVKAFPDKSKFNPTFDEINSLEYLNCVIKETLRLHPPVTLTSRTNIKDEVLGEYLIPKGTKIVIGIGVLHRLPEIWGPTADIFDPKRWLDPSLIKNVTNLNYLPFNNGPRSCIGNKVALTEIKVLLSILIRNFVFQPIEGFHVEKTLIPINKPAPYVKLAVSRVES